MNVEEARYSCFRFSFLGSLWGIWLTDSRSVLLSRELNIRVERRRDPMSGDYFENVAGMMFPMSQKLVTTISGDHMKYFPPIVDEFENHHYIYDSQL